MTMNDIELAAFEDVIERLERLERLCEGFLRHTHIDPQSASAELEEAVRHDG